MSTSGRSATKSKSTEDSVHSVTAPLRSEFWLDDGNVVLQAEETHFKVHRSILSINSTVFKDMFSMPQPTSGEELVEGCPVIHLSDSAADVSYVLQALCQRRYVALGEPLPIEVIAAFLRLGSKYEIETLRVEALKRLFYECPADLDANDEKIDCSMIKDATGIELDLVNLAREQNILSALPIGLYMCCYWWKMGLIDIAKGIQRDDGTHIFLSPADERACFLAYGPLLELQGNTTFSWIDSPSSMYPSCKTCKTCADTRKEVLCDNFFPVAAIWGLDIWSERWEGGMCKACIEVAKEMQEIGRVDFWHTLPSIFGFPEWEELKKERAVMMENGNIASH